MEFVRNNFYFISRCLVMNGRTNLETDGEYTTDRWDQNYKIVQFWDAEDIPEDVRNLVEAWRNSVPEGCHILFNEETARNFIMQRYSRSFVDAYDTCWHPAMKSDFFRLAYLYAHGGLYIDADERRLRDIPNVNFSGGSLLVVFPLMRERNSNGNFAPVTIDDLASRTPAVNGPECYFANSPIFATKKNEAIKAALISARRLIQKAKEDLTTPNIHAITGPTNWTLAIAAHLIDSACSGRKPSDIKIIDWPRYASSQPLKYKDDDRNWRNAARTL
jgi:mannosyltransferase OCH1-like enzyme